MLSILFKKNNRSTKLKTNILSIFNSFALNLLNNKRFHNRRNYPKIIVGMFYSVCANLNWSRRLKNGNKMQKFIFIIEKH